MNMNACIKKEKSFKRFANISLSKAGKFFLNILPISHIRERLMHTAQLKNSQEKLYGAWGKMSLKKFRLTGQ
jgi:hypothetical protein